MKRFLLQPWMMFGLATAVFIFFLLVVLPAEALRLASVTQVSGSPDTSFIYGPQEFYAWASGYGEAGREYYIRSRFTFDLIWPLSYGAFLVTGIRASGLRYRLVWGFLPIFSVLFDYAENVLASFLMGLYPTQIDALVYVTSFATFVKWVTLVASFGLLFVGIAKSIHTLLRRTK